MALATPTSITQPMQVMKTYVGIENAMPASAVPRRLTRVTTVKIPRHSGTM
jgi:hypothetical protein